ncbi:hypothetical protein HaLaN_27907, partial [Haematococcus lacustris]
MTPRVKMGRPAQAVGPSGPCAADCCCACAPTTVLCSSLLGSGVAARPEDLLAVAAAHAAAPGAQVAALQALAACIASVGSPAASAQLLSVSLAAFPEL